MGYLSSIPIPEKPKITRDSPLLCFKDSRCQGQMYAGWPGVLACPSQKGTWECRMWNPGMLFWRWALSSSSLLRRTRRCWAAKDSHAVTRARRKPPGQEEKPGKGEKHRVSWHHAGRWPAPRSVVGTELRLPGLFRQLVKLCLSVSSVCEGRLYSRWTLEGLEGCQDRVAAGKEVSVVEGPQRKENRKGRPMQKPPASHSKSPGRQPMLSSCPNPYPHTLYLQRVLPLASGHGGGLLQTTCPFPDTRRREPQAP